MDASQINIVQIITETINNLFNNLFSSIDNSLYNILDDLLFISPDIFLDQSLETILGAANTNGLILICNSLLLGFALYYACFLILSKFTLTPIQNPYQFIIKLFLCGLAINSSIFICKEFVTFFSNISLAIREIGEIVFNENICLSTFIQKFNSTIYIDNTTLNIFSLDGLLKSFISIGMLNLTISYSIRYILIKFFIIFSPFAFISLLNKSTSWIFKSWIKLFISLLFLQIFIPFILLVSFSIKFNDSDILPKFIYIGSIYALIKANSFVKEFMGGLSTDVSISLSNFKSFFSK